MRALGWEVVGQTEAGEGGPVGFPLPHRCPLSVLASLVSQVLFLPLFLSSPLAPPSSFSMCVPKRALAPSLFLLFLLLFTFYLCLSPVFTLIFFHLKVVFLSLCVPLSPSPSPSPFSLYFPFSSFLSLAPFPSLSFSPSLIPSFLFP